MSFVIKSTAERAEIWSALFAAHLPDEKIEIWPDIADPEAVEFLAAWVPPPDLGRIFPNLKVLFSVGAGVDQLDLSGVPDHVQVVRMIESGLTDGMVDYVRFSVLALHRGMLRYVAQQREQVWQAHAYRPASTLTVGVMGLGQLGLPVLQAIRALGYGCQGWARSRRDIAGVRTFAGPDERDAFLAGTDILVCLLPLTAETAGLLARPLFARLPRGAALVHCGRGRQLVLDDLMAALDEGMLGGAIVDVTDPEPLPAGHALWSRPDVLITPHTASITQADTGGRSIVENVKRYRTGEPLIGLVDRTIGY
ncbi:2-hydroxyacid dehydrogenase [Acidomonas methanolica]|uniref:D-isomer specific 2-hydroxyacid dehydrogenase n=1 Tax=Acidomonas methanolica NBRC 104435 TaxID=1231351 RepID=A0A023D0E7_ACIMT|nr:glyoxylate/hydroxypyruvate reductase A [Acidomonas methanolica]MBU2654143.1 glyoxylate/hydroxypyruvate reductase A [Acidomonas methanolica]TCS30629.1 glyoxylate/hydroxypyruvate reductase A [Acidomonas methanolica]GAJ27607.1 D-isomer specific 2-hydroxyacid dehydrogenase [Acidomonas methanolica NBRC 104435]GBQ54169.1 D-3-phosphoglycerate dehydrogenase [Acidomonas methanolica]GEK98811.1 glyoxylate/hydroxypyruvate reductase A [Acidomonas methanolica NBRC 104435]